MEIFRPQLSYEQRLADWQSKTSIEQRPLTDTLRRELEQRLREGKFRVTRTKDGFVQLEKAYFFEKDLKCYTPIDLERGVVIADGEIQFSDSPIASADLQWLREVAARET